MGYKELKFDKESVFLVTGGAGFIGSNICEAILNMGYTVRFWITVDRKYENIEPFTENERFTFIKGDIRELDTCIEATKGVDYVMNQAAWGSVPRSIEMPLIYEEINIRGTLNMMEASRQNHVMKFVYASSSSVYGDHPKLPKQEGAEGKVLSPYALTKKVDEEYGRLYKELYGLDTYVCAILNVFGRNRSDGAYAAVIPKFIRMLLNGEVPRLTEMADSQRDFYFI